MRHCDKCGEDGRPVQRVLVLSGGGGKGIYEAAWVKAMLDRDPDLDIDAFVGISAGALNASYLAGAPVGSGFGSSESRAALRKRASDLLALWESVGSHRGVYHGDLKNLFAVAWRIFVLKTGALDPAPIRAMIDVHVRAKEISLSGRRLRVGATRLDTGEYVEFGDQCPRITEAVKGSAAIPAAFAPVWVDGARYVDGAIRNNTPLSSAFRMRPSIEILVIQSTPIHVVSREDAELEVDCPVTDPIEVGNALEVLLRSARILSEEVQKDDVEGAWRWHRVLVKPASAKDPTLATKAPIPTRIWAPEDALLKDEKLFEWEDLARMRDLGFRDAERLPILDFSRDEPRD